MLPQLRIGLGTSVARLSAALLGLVIVACSGDDGLVRPGPPVAIAVRTVFDETGPLHAATPFRIDRARVAAVRPSSGDVLAEVETPVAAGQTSLSLDLSVELAESTEQLRIVVELWAGDILAYAGDALMLVEAGTRVNQSPPITLRLAAPSLDVGSESLSFALPMGGEGATQSLEVGNQGAGGLGWQASSDVPWLALSPASGTIPEGGTAVIEAEASASGLEPGVHTGTLTIDAPGALGSPWTLTVTLDVAPNQPPTADAGSDETLTDNDDSGAEDVTLDGSASSDADGSITSWVWTEGGEEIATGATPTVTLALGTHVITLTVTDDDGASASDQVQVSVLPRTKRPPVANAGADQTVTDADESGAEDVTLDGTGSSAPDGSIVSWVWSEGEEIATGATPTVTLAVGTHVITLTVTDDDGASASDQVVITVLAPAPLDLVAGAPEVKPASPTTADAVSIEAIMSNLGGTATGTFAWRLRVGSTEVASGVASLPAGGSATATAVGLGPYPEGTRTAFLDLDYNDEVAESNEGNNTASTSFTVAEGPPTYVTLTVVVDGSGSVGSTGVTPAIDCPAGSCSQAYLIGTEVPLTATDVDPDYTFEHWLATGSGFTCTTDPTCVVTMDEDRTVTAWFPAPGQISVDPGTAAFTMLQGGTPTPASQAITVSNVGDRPVTDVETGTAYSPDVPAWLSASLDRTTIDTLMAGTMTLAVDPNDLDPGAYQATVSVGKGLTVDEVEVTLTVTSAAPVISNLSVELVQVNDTVSCSNHGSRYAVSFDYADPDGDVTKAVATIRDAFVYVPGQSGTWTWPGVGEYSVGADGFSGSIGLVMCTRFDDADSIMDSFTLEDGAGHLSNILSTTRDRPTGANAPGLGASGTEASESARQRAISRWTPKR